MSLYGRGDPYLMVQLEKEKLGQTSEVEEKVIHFISELFKLSHRGALCF